MRWESTLATGEDFAETIARSVAPLAARLGEDSPAVVFAFASPAYGEALALLPAVVSEYFPDALLVGCTGGGVVGGGREAEGEPGVSLTAACLPGVVVHPFRVPAEGAPPVDATAAWIDLVGVAPEDAAGIVLLPEPFSVDARLLTAALDRAYPGCSKVGGLASGAREPGSHVLFLGAEAYLQGAVGVVLTGDVELQTVVAQGCRPVGQPMFATRADTNVIYALDGVAPQQVIQATFEKLAPRDRALANQALFIGLAMNDSDSEPGLGDFLVRHVAGVHQPSGGLVVGGRVHDCQVVQLHVRDAEASSADLRAHLERQRGLPAPAGALLFTCMGRGAGLYGEPGHDTRAFRQALGDVPLGGFFCNGEIGPVHDRTWLHGYTSVFALLRSRSGA